MNHTALGVLLDTIPEPVSHFVRITECDPVTALKYTHEFAEAYHCSWTRKDHSDMTEYVIQTPGIEVSITVRGAMLP